MRINPPIAAGDIITWPKNNYGGEYNYKVMDHDGTGEMLVKNIFRQGIYRGRFKGYYKYIPEQKKIRV